MMVSMAGAATVLMIFRVEEEDQGSVAAGYVTVALVCLFIFNFAYGWGYVCIPICTKAYHFFHAIHI